MGPSGKLFIKMSEQEPLPRRFVYVWAEGRTCQCVWDDEARAFMHPFDEDLVLYLPEEVSHWMYAGND